VSTEAPVTKTCNKTKNTTGQGNANIVPKQTALHKGVLCPNTFRLTKWHKCEILNKWPFKLSPSKTLIPLSK